VPWRVHSRSAFAPTVIVVIPCSEEECNRGQQASDWLPRQCPRCRQMAVVGHGRRQRSALDRSHDRIRVRRGKCNRCKQTLTVLPAWCIPRCRYNLPARQEALQRVADGLPIEQSAPDCQDPDRIADPSTLRRWFWRRIESLVIFLHAPSTLLAWDWRAAARILIPEPNPL